MSSCRLKNVTERYAEPPRSAYDQLFNKMYDPNNSTYNAAPWPMQRTDFDLQMQNEWCMCPQCCNKHSSEIITMSPYTTNPPMIERYGCGYNTTQSLSVQDPSNFASYRNINSHENYKNMNLYQVTPETMHLNLKKGTFILCFAEWCGYCKKYMSKWNEFKQKHGDEYDFVEANMSDSNNIIAPEKVKPMLKNIQGFPTILCVLGKGNSEKIVHNIEKRDDLVNEVKSKFGNNTVCVL
jgi:thiol-disulfide isomerase/thioredoxin